MAITTFSAQKSIISYLLRKAIRTNDNSLLYNGTTMTTKAKIDIPIYGGNDIVDGYMDGKQSQLYLAMEYFNQKRNATTSNNVGIAPNNTVLVDDDYDNIVTARMNGYRTIHYKPEQSNHYNALVLDG